MPSYIEGDETIIAIIDNNPVCLKPILFTTYTPITKYNLEITYEDSTTKSVELVMDKERPYKIIYKKEGKLINVTGIISKIYEINEASKFCDCTNKIMDSTDLLIELDCSEKFECTKVRLYLKDIRDIIDIVTEGYSDDPDDDKHPENFTMYPIYLNEHSCQNTIRCIVDDDLKVTLTSRVTKMGETLIDWEYSDFAIVSVTDPVTINTELFGNNIVPLIFTEDSLNKEIKVILKYFINEINHPVFDEFTIIATRKEEIEEKVLEKAVTSADMQYLGDRVDEILDLDLTPGFKAYRYME